MSKTNQNKNYSLSVEFSNKVENAKKKQSEKYFEGVFACFLCLFIFITSSAFVFLLEQYNLFSQTADNNFINYSIAYQKTLKHTWLMILTPGLILSIISYTAPELFDFAINYKKIYWRDTQQSEEFKHPTFVQIIQQNTGAWIDFFLPFVGFGPFGFFDLKNIVNDQLENQFSSIINFIYHRGLIHHYIRTFTSTCFFWGISIDLISSVSQLIPLLGFVFTQSSGYVWAHFLILLLVLLINILYYVVLTGFILRRINKFILVPLFELLSLREDESEKLVKYF